MELRRLASTLDAQDELRHVREEFLIPANTTYLCGNSLGLQPRESLGLVTNEMKVWATRAVQGHFTGSNPWAAIDQTCVVSMARLVGALPEEIAIMNSLTVNLHLLLVSFLQPSAQNKQLVLIEENAFPSDRFALDSHLRTRGLDPSTCVVKTVGNDTAAVLKAIAQYQTSLCLVLLGGVHYLTGIALDIPLITKAAHDVGALVGLDLAHAAGNIMPLHLHNDQVDFACWCTYKYLNSGPGGIACAFVHSKHTTATTALPRFEGWWGHQRRFSMTLNSFEPRQGAAAWQLSNPPVMQMQCLRAALNVFDSVTDLTSLARKSKSLTGLLETALVMTLPVGSYVLLNPSPSKRGCQLSLRLALPVAKQVSSALASRGFVCDERDPDVIRISPVPLYNTHAEVVEFAFALAEEVKKACSGGRL
jgi:kynureninase